MDGIGFLGLFRRGREYYSVRMGINKAGKNYDLVSFKSLFMTLYAELEARGYFQEYFGYSCVDAGDVEGNLGSDIDAQIQFHLRKSGLWPIRSCIDDYSEHDLFDMIEFLYDHASKGVDGYHHTYSDCGWHYDKFNREEGQLDFRSNINVLLPHYGDGYELSQKGEVLHAVDSGFERLMEAPVPTDGLGEIQKKIEDAKTRFRMRGATVDVRRDAIREFADILELLRPEAKKHLNTEDEADLFHIANKFAIRHYNSSQKKEYDNSIWHSWMFYYYLATIHALLRLIDRGRSTAP